MAPMPRYAFLQVGFYLIIFFGISILAATRKQFVEKFDNTTTITLALSLLALILFTATLGLDLPKRLAPVKGVGLVTVTNQKNVCSLQIFGCKAGLVYIKTLMAGFNRL